MKFEIVVQLENGNENNFITEEYANYNFEKKYINGLHQIGFIKEGKKRNTWIPYKNGNEYAHNVKFITIKELYTGRVVEYIKCE